MCKSGGTAQTVNILLAAEDRERLLASDRRRPLKHVQRARIILLSAERLPVLQIAHQVGVSRPAVWRLQQRHGEEGVGWQDSGKNSGVQAALSKGGVG